MDKVPKGWSDSAACCKRAVRWGDAAQSAASSARADARPEAAGRGLRQRKCNVRASNIIITLCLLAISPLTGGVASADTVSWKAAGNGNWSDGAKWSSNMPPKVGDDVVITIDGTYTVTLDTNANVNSLTLGGSSGVQTLQAGNNTLTLSGPNASMVNVNGVLGAGNLAGASNLTVNGTLNWTNGNISGAGTLVVNGMLVLDSGSSKILDGRMLELNGTGQWKSTGSFYLANGAVLHNAASGTFDMQNNAFMGISGAPSTEKFDNDGMLMKSGSGGGTTTLNVFVDTSTGVSVNNGTLVASNSGTWVGALTTAATTLLRFSGGTHSLSGVTIGGMGRTEVTGGTVNTTGAVTVSATTTLANSATLGGAGALTVHGTLEWTAGTITGAGMLV